MNKFFTCEITFDDADGAYAAMHELAELGIETKLYADLGDPFERVLVEAWDIRAADLYESVFAIAAQHRGLADDFKADVA